MTMKATKDIKVASEREKIETFIDLCSDNKLDYMSIIVQKESSTNKEGKLIGKPAKLKKILTNAGIDDDLATYYALFSMNIYKNDTNKKSKKVPHIKPLNNFAMLLVLSVFQIFIVY